MLGFVQTWLGPRSNPIGVDFGSDCLRMAQVQIVNDEHRLVAAASADVPPHARHDPAARLSFFSETVRDLLCQNGFRGRQAVLALPAASMFIQHLRLPRMEDEALKNALPWEARGKLPIDPSQALLRHLVAGELYHDQESKSEVILFAAAREGVNQLLAAAARAKLDVIGMNVEPMAIVDCFGHIFRRKTDFESTSCFVDIGCTATRAVVARGRQILFARAIPVGGDHFNRAVSASMQISFEDAKVLRIKLCAMQAAIGLPRSAPAPEPAGLAEPRGERRMTAIAGGDPVDSGAAVALLQEEDEPSPADIDLSQQSKAIEAACRASLTKLTEELDLCRRYYETTFPNHPVDRLIFVGGEARQRGLCQQIARDLSLAAQIGDPLCRMGRISEIGIESGIDRRQPQPSWATAFGLSMGQVTAKVEA